MSEPSVVMGMVARACLRLGLALTLVLAGRLAWTAFQRGAAATKSTAEAEPAPALPTRTTAPWSGESSPSHLKTLPVSLDDARRLAIPSVPLPRELIGVAPVSSSDSVKEPEPVHMYLVVRSPPDRTEVRIDGVLVGETPYVGEISCQPSRPVRITLVPPSGMPRTLERRCAATTLHVDEDK